MFVDKIGSPPFPRAVESRPKLPCQSSRRSVNCMRNVHTQMEKCNVEKAQAHYLGLLQKTQ
jgi:hypothetical protein